MPQEVATPAQVGRTLFFPVTSDQAILDMQNELAMHRNIQPDDKMPSKSFLYAYAKYKKEREEAATEASRS